MWLVRFFGATLYNSMLLLVSSWSVNSEFVQWNLNRARLITLLFWFLQRILRFLFISGIYQINLMISVRCFFFDNQILADFRVSFTWLLKFDFTVCLCTMILCKQDTYIIHVQGAYIIHIHGTCILHIMIVHTRLGLSLFDDFLSITSCHVYH